MPHTILLSDDDIVFEGVTVRFPMSPTELTAALGGAAAIHCISSATVTTSAHSMSSAGAMKTMASTCGRYETAVTTGHKTTAGAPRPLSSRRPRRCHVPISR